MKYLLLLAAAASFAAGPAKSGAQAPGVPRVPYGTTDFAKLKWLQGNWAGTTSDGEPPTYQRFRLTNDSTMDITYYRDSAFTQEIGTGRLYLSVGRVYHTFGGNRWAATHIDSAGLYFIPQSAARNNYAWAYVSPDAWTATMRTGVSGHQRVIVYNMKRVPR